MDPLDYLEPIDITSKLPKDLDEQFMSKKWQDRKNALDSVHGILTENPKLADNPDYVRLIEQLTKVLISRVHNRYKDIMFRCSVLMQT
jgi:cytoskeleton-associated protein 5